MSVSRVRRGGLWLSLAFVSLVILEVSSYTVLVFAKTYRPTYFEQPLSFFHDYIMRIEDDYVSRFMSEGYDSMLGWDNRPDSHRTAIDSANSAWAATYDHLGARANPLFTDVALIATYGDSYTHGDEVNNDETWQYYLSQKLRANVQNFGVGGYGTDQALLKLERNFRHGFRAPYVILGVIEENINRILNTFRPFYFPDTGIKLGFKPRFILENGNLRLIPNPMQPFVARADATQALRAASENDYWFMLNRKRTRITFPFSLSVFDLSFLVLHKKKIMRHPYKDLTSPQPWNDLEAVRLMDAIIKRYVRLSSQYHFQPILMFFPEFPRASDHSRARSAYRSFIAGLREQYSLRDLAILDLSEAEFDEEEFRVLPDGGHASAYGNMVIAEFIYSNLCMSNTIPCDGFLGGRKQSNEHSESSVLASYERPVAGAR